MICTTLNKIREHDPCLYGWRKLLAGLNKAEPDDELLPLVRILEINGLSDALWALRTADCDRESRMLAVAYARQVQHLMTDERSVAALAVAERFANGQATRKELKKSHTDALAAADDAWAAWAAARAAYAAVNAVDAAADAANAADAAENAVDAAADAANAADAAENAVDAGDAEWAAMREKQVELFKEMLG